MPIEKIILMKKHRLFDNFTYPDFNKKFINTGIFQINKIWRMLLFNAFLLLFLAAAAQAATFTVTKTADTNDGVCDADCSLREAFAAANATDSADTIEFDAAVFSIPQTIMLIGGELTVTENGGSLTVNGAGANLLTVSGNGNNRVFFINSGASAVINNLKITGGGGTGAIINNAGGAIAVYAARLDLSNVIIEGNSVNGNGGGIYGFFNAEIKVFDSIVRGNRANGGGGIYSQSSKLNVERSFIGDNTASGDGGGIYAIDGVTIINNSTVSSNTGNGGGGILAFEDALTITSSSINNNTGTSGGGISSLFSIVNLFDSVISGNRVSEEGGGIRHTGSHTLSHTLRLTRCRILNNTANGVGGGVMNVREFVAGATVNFLMTYSTVSGNTADAGGGIYNDSSALVVFSTIDHNTANGGGGIFNRSGMALINSTVSGNRAVLEGGGINSIGVVDLHYTAIVFNRATTGAGIFVPTGTLQSRTTLFAKNFRNDSSPEDIFGTLDSGGFNLIENLQNAAVTGNTTGNIVGQDAQLDPVLRNNGGLTQTHALRPNSPAIDAAFSGVAISVKTDQRGRSRTFDFPNIPNAPGSDATDIGAFERQADDVIPASTLFDFDGDGKADISVFRPENGAWYLQQSRSGFLGVQFGSAADRIVPGDYDGDGKTDFAVFRRSADSAWYILQSSDGAARAVQWGAVNSEQAILFDTPVPADYDGDGKTDIAVWQTTAATGEPAAFLILRSSDNSVQVQKWGGAGDIPVPADYDGDGKADFAVYRGGVWYILQSGANELRVVSFGLPSDKAVPADYDGDGKADIAVFRPENGFWYRLDSIDNSFKSVQFGLAEDKPVPADYDGDGKADIAVYRPSNGAWYLLQTTAGFLGFNFGSSTDVPIPNTHLGKSRR